MPLIGAVGELSWRLAWLVIPACIALVATVLLLPAPADASSACSSRAARRPHVSGRRSLVDGRAARLLGWAGALVYVGALLVDTYDLSIAATGLALGFGALIYVPGNLLFRRWVDAYSGDSSSPSRSRPLRRSRSSTRCDPPCGSRSRRSPPSRSSPAVGRSPGSARGLGLAPELRLGVTGVRDCRSPVRLLRRSGARGGRARERRLLSRRGRVRRAVPRRWDPASRASTLTR